MKISAFASMTALFVALSACSSSTPAIGPVGSTSATAASLDTWHDALAQQGLPSAGCFRASYPSIHWNRMACAAPPRIWFPIPRSRVKSVHPNVGNGYDFTADTTPRLISTAIGAFPNVKGVKTVTSVGCCGIQGLNSYSLQMNSQFFPTEACESLANCLGWEQFVYSNPTGSQLGALFIEDWLVSTQGSFSNCPPNAGWINYGIGCVQNSLYAAYVPNIAVTDMKNVAMTGVAASGGDSIYLSVGTNEYGMKNLQSDGITDLAKHWKGVEYNIIGNAGGDRADFTGKSDITVSIQTDTGRKKAPACPANTGTTGESNNLTFDSAPKQPPMLKYPSIEFNMSLKGHGTPSCDSVAGS